MIEIVRWGLVADPEPGVVSALKAYDPTLRLVFDAVTSAWVVQKPWRRIRPIGTIGGVSYRAVVDEWFPVLRLTNHPSQSVDHRVVGWVAEQRVRSEAEAVAHVKRELAEEQKRQKAILDAPHESDELFENAWYDPQTRRDVGAPPILRGGWLGAGTA